MTYLILKYLLSAFIVVLISEVSKKSSFIGAITASLPLVSILGMIWLYYDTKNIGQVVKLSKDIFWLVIPSLSLFILFPVLAKRFDFAISLSLSVVAMMAFYGITVLIMRYMKF
jgi:hypothetical protein